MTALPDETEAAPPRLPRFVRFRDLAAAGIVDNWQQLHRLIDEHSFPAGMQLSPNIRVWDVADVLSRFPTKPTS